LQDKVEISIRELKESCSRELKELKEGNMELIESHKTLQDE
jgi:hypothetical protein